MFKQYKYINDIRVYSKWTYEKLISHEYYCQIVTHEVCVEKLVTLKVDPGIIYSNQFVGNSQVTNFLCSDS
jgi:hypothetical protein